MKYFYSTKKKSNILINVLETLNTKYTTDYASKLFREHPHKNNLYGLSLMLTDYGIDNIGVKIKDKENDSLKLNLPFIAHLGSDFVLVNKFTSQLVSCSWNEEKLSVSLKEFNERWTGSALLIQSNQNSIEPNYKRNRMNSFIKGILNSILFISVILLLIISYTNQTTYNNINLIPLVIVNSIGLYVSYLLVTKQLHANNEYIDKFCTIIKDGNCNRILDSNVAKLWGIIGWSEIGLGYFTANLLIIIFTSSLISYSMIINICALPYTFWSIWYQKFKAKQWCTLCLLVQISLWSILIINIIIDITLFPPINLKNILYVACIYSIPTLLINLSIQYIIKKENIEEMRQDLNAIKASSDFFLQAIKKEPIYLVSNKNSQIIFGNIDSSIRITILLNPHCFPCAKIYKESEEFIKTYGDKISIQYIFHSSNKKLDLSNKLLIAIYLNSNQKVARKIFSDWFEGEEKRFYFKDSQNVSKYNEWAKKEIAKYIDTKNETFDISEEYINDEFLKHESWKNDTGLKITPVILINGYKLPDYYKLEDLKYHIDLKI